MFLALNDSEDLIVSLIFIVLFCWRLLKYCKSLFFFFRWYWFLFTFLSWLYICNGILNCWCGFFFFWCFLYRDFIGLRFWFNWWSLLFNFFRLFWGFLDLGSFFFCDFLVSFRNFLMLSFQKQIFLLFYFVFSNLLWQRYFDFTWMLKHDFFLSFNFFQERFFLNFQGCVLLKSLLKTIADFLLTWILLNLKIQRLSF